MTTKHDLFNDESICIFTDSSFRKSKNRDPRLAIGTTAPAYCIFLKDECIECGFHILHESTSQQGELYAMLLGVMASYKYRNYPHIRIFADNQNAVFAIRQWIFNWVRETNNGKNALGYGGRISNQDMIMDIIYTIISNQIYLEIYHVKGHVNTEKYDSIIESRNLFKRSNPFVGFVEDALIYQLAIGNNMVDAYSTEMLKEHLIDEKYDTRGLFPAVTIGYSPDLDMNEYIKLVNKDGKRRE